MNDTIKNFIEVNVDLLQTDPVEFFHIAYNGLSHYNQGELVSVLDNAGLNTYAARESVFRYIITMMLDELGAKVSLRMFVSRKLAGVLGFKFDEAFNYVLDNEDEWNNTIRLENGMYYIYPVDV